MVILARRIVSRQGDGAATASAAARHSTPSEVQGRWITATSGDSSHWSHDTGVYQGSGHGSSQIYESAGDGNYKYFIYMEVRTNFSYVKLNTNCAGTVEFDGDQFTLHPMTGHISAEGTTYEDRDMKADDLARWAKTYRWQRENGGDGKPSFVVIGEEGARERSEFKALQD